MLLVSKSHKLLRFSGQEVIKILVKYFGFESVRQKGSHVVLRKFLNGRKITTIIPLQQEIKTGTLMGILELAEIRKEEFLEKAQK